MKKILTFGIMLMFLLMTVSSANEIYLEKQSFITIFDGKTLYVGGNGPGNYSNIQDAIDNASDGDTVFVYNGTYDLTHNDISINKSINLIGENKVNTIINGSNFKGIWVYVSEVLIDGFTFLHSGIRIFNSNQINITNNIIDGFGISFDFLLIDMFYSNANNNTISDNSFFNCGLILWGYNNIVSNNTVNGKPLVYLESTSDEIIDNAGQVILIDCSNITVQDTNISFTDVGIQLYECSNCNIISNLLSHNSFLGMSIINSTYNTILENIIDKNVFAGLSIANGENNNISSNSFQNGNFLNLILQYSSDNLILKNNFIFNSSFSILKNILHYESDNKWKGNYWNESRKLPVFIWGFKIIRFFRYRTRPCLDIDWHPVSEPYDIGI